MLIEGMVTSIAILLGSSGIGIYNLNEEQKNMLSGLLDNGWKNGTFSFTKFFYGKMLEPKDITEIRKNDFNFKNDETMEFDLVLALNNTKIADLEEKELCILYEDNTPSTLRRVIDLIGTQNNLTSDQVELMKLSVEGGRMIHAMQFYNYGVKGYYRLMKYTSARLASGNYDFMIANYGYTWTLNLLTKDDALRAWQVSDVLGGVPVGMLPEEARNDVVEFVRINSDNSITMADAEKQKKMFRGKSEKSLAELCPTVNK